MFVIIYPFVHALEKKNPLKTFFAFHGKSSMSLPLPSPIRINFLKKKKGELIFHFFLRKKKKKRLYQMSISIAHKVFSLSTLGKLVHKHAFTVKSTPILIKFKSIHC